MAGVELCFLILFTLAQSSLGLRCYSCIYRSAGGVDHNPGCGDRFTATNTSKLCYSGATHCRKFHSARESEGHKFVVRACASTCAKSVQDTGRDGTAETACCGKDDCNHGVENRLHVVALLLTTSWTRMMMV